MANEFPSRKGRCGGLAGMSGAVGFAVIVIVLHLLQPDFDPRKRLISELAQGPHGWAMTPAFGLLALSLFGVQHGLGIQDATRGPRMLLGAAALAMLAAGVFPMGRATALHIALVTPGAGMILAAMCLLPPRAGRLQSRSLQAASLGLFGGAALSAAAAGLIAPIGVAQRLAAAFVVAWLCLVSWKLAKAGGGVNPCSTCPGGAELLS